jgi:hypothetical protein
VVRDLIGFGRVDVNIERVLSDVYFSKKKNIKMMDSYTYTRNDKAQP